MCLPLGDVSSLKFGSCSTIKCWMWQVDRKLTFQGIASLRGLSLWRIDPELRQKARTTASSVVCNTIYCFSGQELVQNRSLTTGLSSDQGNMCVASRAWPCGKERSLPFRFLPSLPSWLELLGWRLTMLDREDTGSLLRMAERRRQGTRAPRWVWSIIWCPLHLSLSPGNLQHLSPCAFGCLSYTTRSHPHYYSTWWGWVILD